MKMAQWIKTNVKTITVTVARYSLLNQVVIIFEFAFIFEVILIIEVVLIFDVVFILEVVSIIEGFFFSFLTFILVKKGPGGWLRATPDVLCFVHTEQIFWVSYLYM